MHTKVVAIFFGDADGNIIVSPVSRKCTQKNIFIYYIARLFSFKFLHVLASCLNFLAWPSSITFVSGLMV